MRLAHVRERKPDYNPLKYNDFFVLFLSCTVESAVTYLFNIFGASCVPSQRLTLLNL